MYHHLLSAQHQNSSQGSGMATQIGGHPISSILFGRAICNLRKPTRNMVQIRPSLRFNRTGNLDEPRVTKFSIQCSEKQTQNDRRTCRYCKTQFDPLLNHPRACRYHTAHFGGETKRKFESVYTGGTMTTPDSGKVYEYWHCCGSEDPFDPGCTAAPHASYDD